MTIKLESLSAHELRSLVEDMWEDASTLKSQCYFLVNNLENMLDPGRGRREGEVVTLQFWDDSLNSTEWLAGCVWNSVGKIEHRIAKLFDDVGP